MKAFFKRKMNKFSLSNVILVVIILLFVFKQTPTIANNLAAGGKRIETDEYFILNAEGNKEKSIRFPQKDQKRLVIFWATWCGPCKLEMKRLASSVETKKIPKDSILAIAPFEDPAIVREYLKTNPYPFQFLEEKKLAFQLNVTATPTTLFVDNGEIVSMSSGLSLFGIFKAEKFLSNR